MEDSSSEEDDPVVGEVDVFLSQSLAENLYLVQVREKSNTDQRRSI